MEINGTMDTGYELSLSQSELTNFLKTTDMYFKGDLEAAIRRNKIHNIQVAMDTARKKGVE